MKFGKQFEFYKIPEWSEYYLDYLELKIILKILDNRKKRKFKPPLKILKAIINRENKDLNTSVNYENSETSSNMTTILKDDEEIQELNKINIEDDEKTIKAEKQKENEKVKQLYNLIIEFQKLSDEQKLIKFIEIYHSKILIIQNFFVKKINEYNKLFHNLKKKIDTKHKTEKQKDEDEQENKERDELGYAVSWKRAMSNLYNYTSWLHSFYSINSLAIQKIQKKAIKFFNFHLISSTEYKLKKEDEKFKLHALSSELIILRKKIKVLYSEELTNGNLSKATQELDQRLLGGSRIKQTKLIFFYLGVSISFFIFFLILNSMESLDEKDMLPFFPAFNYSLCMIFGMIGVGICLYILRKYRINYIYIFDINSKSSLGPGEMFQNGMLFLSLWNILLVCAKLSINFNFFNSNYALFSFIVNIMMVILIFLPYHILYYTFRKGIITTFIHNLVPYGKNNVRFKDFFLGEVITSYTKPICSMILAYNLMACPKCRKANSREDYNRNNIPCLIAMFYPFVIRLLQCINKYYYTHLKFPHLCGCFKAFGAIIFNISQWVYNNSQTDRNYYIYVTLGFVIQTFMYWWELYVDWGLFRVNNNHLFLRDKITYPKFTYYIAIVTDGILRYLWSFNLFLYHIPTEYDELYNFGTAILEIIRKIQWIIFRLENENLNNPEQYRTILSIPELPVD